MTKILGLAHGLIYETSETSIKLNYFILVAIHVLRIKFGLTLFLICCRSSVLWLCINPLVTNGLSHPYHLEESTFIIRGIRSCFFWLAAEAASRILGPFNDTEIIFRRSSLLGDFIRHAQGSLFLHLGLLRQTPCTNNKREQTISSPIGTSRTLLYLYHTLPLP